MNVPEKQLDIRIFQISFCVHVEEYEKKQSEDFVVLSEKVKKTLGELENSLKAVCSSAANDNW